MDIALIEENLKQLTEEAVRFGAKTAISEIRGTDAPDGEILDDMIRRVLGSILDEHNLSSRRLN